MLSFAVGGLLGDVFLHLLPEAHHKLYAKAATAQDQFQFIHDGHMAIGIWILIGILTFIFVEMIFNINKNVEASEEQSMIPNHTFGTKEKEKRITGKLKDRNRLRNQRAMESRRRCRRLESAFLLQTVRGAMVRQNGT